MAGVQNTLRILAAWQDIIGLAKILQGDCRILAAWHEIIGLCQDLTIWYSESWRHGKVCRGLAKIYSTILAAWQEIIRLAGMLQHVQAASHNLDGRAGSYWACQDIMIWYPESWRHGKVCRGLAKISPTILAAWQEIIGLARMLQADLQNLGGMAGQLLGLPRPHDLIFRIMAAWQGVQITCQDICILAAWQQNIEHANILLSGT